MEIEAILDDILAEAKRSPAVLDRLLATADGPNPVSSFCALAGQMGFPLSEMDLIYAGEEAYAAMRRSTNGGGENSPLLAGEDDYYELFFAKLRAVKDSHKSAGHRLIWAEASGKSLFGAENDKSAFLKDYVGVFDSGVGGISVLSEMMRLLPEENFYYFGDSANAPYGEKSEDWVRTRSMQIADSMIEKGAKAIVIACNTATAAAAADIRGKYPDVPVIGVEPALKVAVTRHQGEKFLVMATNVTLRLEKYHALEQRLGTAADFFPLACDGLAARIEKGDLDADDLFELLERLLSPYIGQVDGVVLGCTHYPLIKAQIMQILGDIPMYDGGEGTARELARRLTAAGIRAKSGVGQASRLRAESGVGQASGLRAESGVGQTSGSQAASEKRDAVVLLESSKKEPGQKELYEWFCRLAAEEVG